MATLTLRPNADGDNTDLTPSAGDNYECVDEEVADDDTSYNYTSANSVYDLYALPNHTTETGAISYVKLYIRAKGSTSPSGFRPCIKTGGSLYLGGGDIAGDTGSYETLSYQWNANPKTSSAWTWTDIDGLQVGGTAYNPGSEQIRLTQVYVEVSYTPSTTYNETVNETINISDAPTSRLDAFSTAPDTFALQDSPTSGIVVSSGISENISLQDSNALFNIFNEALSENFTLDDAVSARAEFNPLVSEGLLLTDTRWLSGWGKRVLLTLDTAKVTEVLNHFPVLVSLSSSCGISSADMSQIFDELGANKYKIAFTGEDGVTQLYAEIVSWDEVAKTAEIWVSKSSWKISNIYLYYDAAHDDNTGYVGAVGSTPAKAVWDANFVLVDHMNDGADTSHTKDSTSNGNNGTKKGAEEPVEANGLIGKAQSFDGTDDYIDLAANATLNFINGTAITIETVLKPSGVVADARLLAHRNAYTLRHSNTKLGFGLFIDGAWREYDQNTSFTVDSFNMLQTTYSTSDKTLRSYLNGNLDRSDKLTGLDSYVIVGENKITRIGDWVGGGYGYSGVICESRISNVARSAAWLNASYDTCWDNLYTYTDSSPESPLAQMNMLATALEDIQLSDIASTRAILQTLISEGLELSDSAAAKLTAVAIALENMALDDSVNLVHYLNPVITEEFTLADAIVTTHVFTHLIKFFLQVKSKARLNINTGSKARLNITLKGGG